MPKQIDPEILSAIEQHMADRLEANFTRRTKHSLVDDVVKELRREVLDNFEFRLQQHEAKIENLHQRLLAAESKTK